MVAFFLSYAAGDDDDGEVKVFFDNLQKEVAANLPELSDGDVGFYAPNITVGTEWSTELEQRVADCASMVALVSPRYIASLWCGREYRAFLNRLEEFERSQGHQPALLIPLMWRPLQARSDMPEVIAARQFNNVRLPRSYADNGALHLLRRRTTSENEAYQTFIDVITNHIVKTVRNHRLPAQSPPQELKQLDSAFAPAAEPVQPPRTSPPAPPDEPPPPPRDEAPPLPTAASYVFVVVGAASSGEIQAHGHKTSVEYYGASFEDWDPYLASPRVLLGTRAGEVIAGAFGQSRVHRAHPDDQPNWTTAPVSDLPRLVEAAGRNRQIIVLLVDVWTADIPGYSDILLKYDQASMRRYDPVLVPWNTDDPDTRDKVHWDTLQRVLPNNYNSRNRRPTLFHGRVESVDGFASALRKALGVAVSRLVASTKTVDRTASAPPRPELRGP